MLTPSKAEHLNTFEEDLCDLARNMSFKKNKTVFENQVSIDIKMISKGQLLFIPVDKTNKNLKKY